MLSVSYYQVGEGNAAVILAAQRCPSACWWRDNSGFITGQELLGSLQIMGDGKKNIQHLTMRNLIGLKSR